MRSDMVLGLSAAGFHRVQYVEWGDPANPRVLLCVHGLTQTGRDFDTVAAALSDGWRVICPDVVGRGRSDWLANAEGYGFPQYMADMTALIARSGAATVDWIGTSMGGLIGMLLAALPQSPIRRLVMNDIGPLVPDAGQARIGSTVANVGRFPDLAAFAAHFREMRAPFGSATEDEWSGLIAASHRVNDDGTLSRAYDPAIGQQFAARPPGDIDLWSSYDAIQCPVLVVRGTDSDILLGNTAAEMTTRGPKAQRHEVPGAGHAPWLNTAREIAMIRAFLN